MKTSYRIVYNTSEVSCNIVDASILPEFAKNTTSAKQNKYPVILAKIHPKENENNSNNSSYPAGGIPVHSCSSTHH